jgi:hypothetical protein
MQGKVADMYSTMMASKAYVYAVGQACDRATTPEQVRNLRKDAAGAILYSAEKATWMAGEAIQTLGGNGYINEYPVGRLWRDAKLYEIGAGTSEIRRMLIGRELFAGDQVRRVDAAMTQAAFPKLLRSQIAFDIARTIRDGFDKHYRLFRATSKQARQHRTRRVGRRKPPRAPHRFLRPARAGMRAAAGGRIRSVRT